MEVCGGNEPALGLPQLASQQVALLFRHLTSVIYTHLPVLGLAAHVRLHTQVRGAVFFGE